MSADDGRTMTPPLSDAELVRDIARGPLPSDFTDETKARLNAIADRLEARRLASQPPSVGDGELSDRAANIIAALCDRLDEGTDPTETFIKREEVFDLRKAIEAKRRRAAKCLTPESEVER